MNLWSIISVAVLAVVAFAALVADLRDDGHRPPTFSAMDRGLGHGLGFFGIGGIPPMLGLTVLASTALVVVVALELIAQLSLGENYPVWFPANALATGLGVGLACDRLLAVENPNG